MDPSLLQQLFTDIRAEWQSLDPEQRPWGVWMTLHTPLPEDAVDINKPMQSVQRAWFLYASPALPQEKSIWEFIRFWLMHMVRPWDPSNLAPSDPRFAARCYPLGMAAFAPYADSQTIYLETIWGGRWGMGRRLAINEQGQIEPLRGLWIA